MKEDPNADLNTGRPWSRQDVRDLRRCIQHKEPTEDVATFLCRSPREVIDKAKEFGVDLPRAIAKRKKPVGPHKGGAPAGIKRAKL